jgi:hypothetical protein
MICPILALLVLSGTVAPQAGDPPSDTRTLLDQVSEHARVARLHPHQAWNEADAAARLAHQIADQAAVAGDQPLRAEASSLARATDELSDAARRDAPADVMARAIDVQASVAGFVQTLKEVQECGSHC